MLMGDEYARRSPLMVIILTLPLDGACEGVFEPEKTYMNLRMSGGRVLASSQALVNPVSNIFLLLFGRSISTKKKLDQE
jgi:hypothetical protein